MALKRFSVSLDEKLVEALDNYVRRKNYPTRSKAVSDFIREGLVEKEWVKSKEVTGVIILIYEHRKRNLMSKLIAIQHRFYQLIVSSQHIHLDHDNCLEMVVIRGGSGPAKKLTDTLRAVRGVKYVTFSAAIARI